MSSSVTFLKINEVNFNDLKFPKLSSGRKFLSVFYNKKKLGVKLPKLRIPFDTKISPFNTVELNVSLGANQELISKFEELDRVIPAFAEEHNWNVENLEYAPTLKKSNSSYPPTIKLKVPVKDSEIVCTFFDDSKEEIKVKTQEEVCNLLPKGTNLLTAIECTGVWFNDSKYGVSWKLSQARVEKHKTVEELMEDCAFEDDSDLESIESNLLIDE
jgi:hypothetical protein